MTSYFLSNPTATSDVLANCISQEAIYKIRNDSSPKVALLAQLKHAKSNKICLNCHHSGHQPGGAMEGKKDEVLAAKAKARAHHSKEKGSGNNGSGGVKQDKTGRAYIINATSGVILRNGFVLSCDFMYLVYVICLGRLFIGDWRRRHVGSKSYKEGGCKEKERG